MDKAIQPLTIHCVAQLVHSPGKNPRKADEGTLEEKLIISDRMADMEDSFRHPCRIDGLIILLCTGGSACWQINLKTYEITQGMMMILTRDQILQFNSKNSDFQAQWIALSAELMPEMRIDLKQAIPIFMYVKENPGLLLTEQKQQEMDTFCRMIHYQQSSSEKTHRVAIIQRLLEAMFYKILSIYQSRIPGINPPRGRKEEFFERFMELLSRHHKQERSMGFYAEQLHITPKYLSSVIKEVSHKSAVQWVDDYVLLEAKSLLKYSGLSIQEIAYQLNFPTQSFFGKYFKRHTGISPSEYKRRVQD